MGCDIHTYIERKHKDVWQSWDSYRYDHKGRLERIDLIHGRDYQLFSILAGVRGSEECVKSPRGFPRDASETVIKHWKSWGEDAHSMSYFTLEELKRYDVNNDNYRELVGKLECMAEQGWADHCDIRIIFWFDS